MRFSYGFGLGIILAALALECSLQYMPVNSGLRMETTDFSTPYSRYMSQQAYLSSGGWDFSNARHGVTNRQGFVNSADFGNRADVLVVGDSYIESLMLEYTETVQGNLDRALGGGVYAAAASGNRLADSLSLVRYFLPRIHPRTVVLFIKPPDISDILWKPSRGHSGFVVTNGVVSVLHQPYQESSYKQLMLRSALARYLYYNLKFPDWAADAIKFSKTATVITDRQLPDQRPLVLNYYFSQLHALGDAVGVRFIFLLDGDRKSIYAGRTEKESTWKSGDIPFFMAAARSHGFEVVNMQPVFARHWEAQRERMDFFPTDGHWNRVAHRLAAEQLLLLIRAAAPK